MAETDKRTNNNWKNKDLCLFVVSNVERQSIKIMTVIEYYSMVVVVVMLIIVVDVVVSSLSLFVVCHSYTFANNETAENNQNQNKSTNIGWYSVWHCKYRT